MCQLSIYVSIIYNYTIKYRPTFLWLIKCLCGRKVRSILSYICYYFFPYVHLFTFINRYIYSKPTDFLLICISSDSVISYHPIMIDKTRKFNIYVHFNHLAGKIIQQSDIKTHHYLSVCILSYNKDKNFCRDIFGFDQALD